MTALSASWKKFVFVIAAGLLLLLASRGSGSGQGAAAADAALPAAQVPAENGPPPSNEISELQQLD